MSNWLEIREHEKKLELKDEFSIVGKWLLIAAGLFVFGVIILLGLGQVF